MLYFTLVGPKVYLTSAAWNSVTFDACKLEDVTRNFVSCSRRRRFFFSHLDYKYSNVLNYLILLEITWHMSNSLLEITN
jgi:hypothetical protein